MDFLDGHHYDGEKNQGKLWILHVVQRKVVVIVGGEDSGFNLDGQQLRWWQL